MPVTQLDLISETRNVLPVAKGGAGGGVNPQTGTSYTVVQGDNRKLVYFDNASAVAVAIVPSANLGSTFFCWLENLGAGTVTLTPDGSETIDGAASLTLDQNQGVMLFSDGSNLFTSRGRGSGAGGGSVTFAGDLSGDDTSQTVVGLQGKELDATTVGSPSDGDVIAYDDASGKYKAAAPSGGGGGLISYVTPSTLTPPDLTGFTSFNLGSIAHSTNSGGALWMHNDTVGSRYVGGYLKSVPTTPWSAIIGCIGLGMAGGSYPDIGLILQESSSGKLIAAGFRSSGDYVFIQEWSSPTSYTAAYVNTGSWPLRPIAWVKVTDDGTNLTWFISLDGQSWLQIYQKSRSDWFTTGPDNAGIYLRQDVAYGALILHWSLG